MYIIVKIRTRSLLELLLKSELIFILNIRKFKEKVEIVN